MLRETGWLLLVQAVLWVRPHYLQQNCLLSKCNQNNLEEIYPGFGGGAQRFGGGAQGFGGGTGFGGGVQGFGGGAQGFGGGAQGFVGGAPGFAGGAPFGPNIFSSSFNPTLNIQDCRYGSQCAQNNLRKKRIAVLTPLSVDSEVIENSEVKKYFCNGGVVSSTCVSSQCSIVCSDNVQFNADCGSQATSLSSSPLTEGRTVVTVTCGGEQHKLPLCFPFCSTRAGLGGSHKRNYFVPKKALQSSPILLSLLFNLE